LAACPPYLAAMNYFARFSPLRGIRDLRLYLAQRRPFELGFLALSVVVTSAVVAGFAHDSHADRVYRKNIIYVEQWPASRSDAEITAQQKIDQVIAHKKQAELEKLQKERQAEFKRLDDKLKAMGI